MARLLIFSDIHNDARSLQNLIETSADYYFCAGDLVSWARGLEKMAGVLKPRAERVYLLPGNHESERDIAEFCKRHGFTNFHGAALQVNGTHVAGLGYSGPTPFHTPGEYSEEELAARLSRFAPLKPLILICHAPPFDTELDRIRQGFMEAAGRCANSSKNISRSTFFAGTFMRPKGWPFRSAPRARKTSENAAICSKFDAGSARPPTAAARSTPAGCARPPAPRRCRGRSKAFADKECCPGRRSAPARSPVESFRPWSPRSASDKAPGEPAVRAPARSDTPTPHPGTTARSAC